MEFYPYGTTRLVTVSYKKFVLSNTRFSFYMKFDIWTGLHKF